jgi:hypothetical protein
MDYLSLYERLRSLALSDVTKISLSLLAKFVTEPTYPQYHIVVSPYNVAISMTDIFASFAKIHLKVKNISLSKKYFFHIRQENFDKCAALTLNNFTCMTPRKMSN